MAGNKLTKFWQELKRRKVIAVIIVYAATAFILIQLANLFESSLNLPHWFDTVITITLLIGFPIAVIFSWVFDVSSKGITKTEQETDTEKNKILIAQNSVPDKSILVLPFDNLSPDPDQEYFSDGLTEEIITDLSYIHDLLVISRSSAMTFKGTKQTIKEIAGKVNVRYVLEGSVRKSGNNLRIVAQLIDASNDSHIWAEKYSGTMDDIFDIQEKVSRSIADSLTLKLNQKEEKSIAERPIDNPLAYELYLKARTETLKFTKEGLDNALLYLQKGLDIMGENVLLIAGMGYVYYQYVNLGIWNDDASAERIEEYAQKVFAIEPDSPYGHLILGLRNIWRNPQEGIIHLKKTLSINPNDLDALGWSCAVYANIGKKEAAFPLASRLMEIDPLNDFVHLMPGFIQFWDGQMDKALDLFKKGSISFPDNYWFPWLSAISLACNHDFEEACLIFHKYTNDMSGNPLGDLSQKYKAALEGNQVEALNWNTPDSEVWARRDFQLSYFVAQIYSVADAKKEALDWLEHAVDIGMINYPFINKHDSLLENIRQEPRFKKLMKKVKKEWENFEV
jgi:TolB-like protein